MKRIEVLGELAIYDGDPPNRLNIRSLGKALVYLALHEGRFVRRTQIAEDLWSDEGYSVAGNRLRVSLNRLKDLVGESLVIEREEVALMVAGVDVDYFVARDQVLEALDEVDEEQELDSLKRLLPAMGKGILEEWDDGWLIFLRGEWRQVCMRGLRRLADLAGRVEDWESIRAAFEAGRKHLRFDTELWRHYMNALYQLGEIETVIRELRVVAAEVEDEEIGRQAQELLTQARTLRDSQDQRDAWEKEQDVKFLGDILLQFLDKYPAKAGEVLATAEFDDYFVNDPKRSLVIFTKLWGQLEPGTPAWIEVGIRVTGFHYFRYEWENTERVANLILPHVDDLVKKARLIYYRSWSSFQTRQWDKAMEDVRVSEKLFMEAGTPERALAVKMNRASYLWHQGYFDEALAIYGEMVPAVEGSDATEDIRHLAITKGNSLFIHLYEGRTREAAECYEACMALLGRIGYRNIDAMMQTVAGIVYTRLGDVRRGIELEITGLRLTYGRGGSREAQIGLEWAAGILMEVGRGAEAVALLDWVDSWRKKTRHERSFAEARYADEIYQKGKANGHRVRLDPDESLRNVMAFVIRLLRQEQNAR